MDWAEVLAGPLVEWTHKRLGAYLNTMVADLGIEGKGQYLRDLFGRFEDELLAHLRKSGIGEYMETVETVVAKLDRLADYAHNVSGDGDEVGIQPESVKVIMQEIFSAKAKLLAKGERPEGCICSEAYGVSPEQCGKHARVPESATLQADSSIGWYFYNGRKFERREPAESATPVPELSDKDGWLYDPDAKLAEIRAGMPPPLGVCDGERAILHEAGACRPCENWRAASPSQTGEPK